MRSSDSRAVVVFLLFAAFMLRIVNLTGESLWRDEVDSVRFAFEPLGNIFARFTAIGFNGPLYHLILRFWLSLAGVSDFALRYLSLTCGVVLVALVYALGRRMFGACAALIAAGLATVSPVLVWYAGEGKMYSLQPMLLALALYALLRATGLQPGWQSLAWWAVFVIATSFSFYIHVLSPLFLPVVALFFFALWPASRRHLAGGAIALALLTLPYLPLLVWQAPALLRGGDIGHPFHPLDQIAWVLASNWIFGLDARAPLLFEAESGALTVVRRVGIGVGTMLIVAGLGMTARRAIGYLGEAMGLRLQLATLGWLALPTLLVFLVSMRMPIFQPRYVLWSVPALYLLIAVGLASLFEKGRAGRMAACAALTVIALVGLTGVMAQIVHPIRPDLRGAVAYVVQRAQPGDVIVFQIPYMQHSFAYYAERFGYPLAQVRIVEAPFTNHGMTPGDAARTISALTSPAERVWLFESEAAMWDQRGLVRRWFDEALMLLDQRAFRSVEVGLYRAKEF